MIIMARLWKKFVRFFVIVVLLIFAFVVVRRTWDDTVYAPGFSEAKFKSIRIGMPKEVVIRILGKPLSIESASGHIYWAYKFGSKNASAIKDDSYMVSADVVFHANLHGKIIAVYGKYSEMLGHSLEDVRKRFGDPVVFTEPNRDVYWYAEMKGIKGQYTRSIVIHDTGLVGSINAGRVGHYTGSEGERPANFIEWLEWNF